ncbi:insulin-like receptor [Asbolus verrucosus]|uniref:Insulin-like receptor n=1 Tax=Asbolus verrucosus TaxID=1661398 RepID=A0A482WE96_ASBVE|nr:insulin-like receptor [Asbolus verrucosus]
MMLNIFAYHVKKECAGVNIDSITLAKQLRGCTHITSSLEIQIRGGRNVVNELEENLGMIEEIDGYLKVVRSFPLVSLNFLKNLKRINGNQLESQKYVFVVLDNQNLQELWDWGTKKELEIKNEIEGLQKIANLGNSTELEVATNSNGDVDELIVEPPKVRDSRGVVLEWKPFIMKDQRKLLGYIVYSIEAPIKNVTLYDGRDACGGDGWRVDDVPIPDDENKITHPLTALKPYTQYAYYVKTYTIATEKRGAQSEIGYFMTLPSTPTLPIGLDVTSDSFDSLKVTWKPPLQPNGNLTHYIVSGKKLTMQMDYGNYCVSPTKSSKHTTVHPSPPVAPPVSTTTNNDTCSCYENKPSTPSINEGEEHSRIKFEDELHNAVYVKKKEIPESRRKRDTSIETFPNDFESQMYKTNNNDIKNSTENGTNVWASFSFKVYGKTEFFVSNLHHFTNYAIHVQACRAKSNDTNDKGNYCSTSSVKQARTLMKEGADDIKQVQITNQSLEMVSITWKEPEDPNGVILSYTIEYRKLDNENQNIFQSKPVAECVTPSQFLNRSRIHTLKKLLPGNYSLRVISLSSAEMQAFSQYIYFYIEEPRSNTTLIVVICITLIVDDPSTPLRIAGDNDVNFSLNSDDSDDDFGNDTDTHIRFPSIPIDNKDGITTANGYVSGCPTNGAATTQC